MDFFNDMPEEADVGGEELVDEQVAAVENGEVVDFVEEPSGEFSQVLTDLLTENEAEVLSGAQERLDRARLYEMLIKHDLFSGVSANRRAIQKVQDEIKNFFLERLEVLLGMREERVQQPVAEPQFNDVEVEALKDIAAKLTKNASRDVEQPRQVQAPKPQTLKPLALTAKSTSAPAPRTVPVQPHTPNKRPVKVSTPENPAQGVEKNLTRADLEKMKPENLRKLNESVPRQKRAVSSKYIPPLDADQKEMMYAKQMRQSANEGSVIMDLLAATGKLTTGVENVDSGNDDGDVNGRI